VTESLQDEGSVSQDYIGGFSMKQEYINTYIQAYNIIYIKFK
jgi:hypothetical protein